MGQQFAADAQSAGANITVVTTAQTVIATTVPIRGPFGSCKALVNGTLILLVGAGTTSLNLSITRNPSGENLQIASAAGVQVTAGNMVSVSLSGIDRIPDGRDVVYQFSVVQNAATGNGTIQATSLLDATLISG